MTRKTLGQKEVANQLIEDKERYRTHPDCRTLVCLVYDPEGYCDNPVALEKDVAAIFGWPPSCGNCFAARPLKSRSQS